MARLVPMLNMEEKLCDDTQAVYVQETKARLKEYSASIQQMLDKGLPSEEFSQYAALKNAIEQSHDVVEKVWQQIHAG